MMNEWKEYKLGDISQIVSKRTSVNNARLENYISTENMINNFGGVVKAEKLPIANSVNCFSKNDILFSNIRTYFKKVWLSNFDGTVSPDVLVFRLNRNICINSFLYYLLCNPDFTEFSVLTSKGAKMPRGDRDALLKYPICLPSFPEQTAIASILSSLDDKIDLLHRQNDTLQKMAETLFRQWFVEEAKEDWEMGKIEDLFILQRGFDLPIQNRISGDYPIIASSGESGYHIEFKVKGPGVTTGRSGVLGNVFFIQEDFWPLNTSLFIKEFKNSSPLHSYFLLKTIDLNSFNAGSAVPTLNRNHVHEFPIEIPPMLLIKKFDEMAIPIFKKIKFNQTQIRTVTNLRDTLLPKLMSGEVRVKVD